MKNKIVLFFVVLFLCSFNFHKYYVSTGLYEYRNDLESLQITIRVFEDDFTNIIKSKYQIDLGLIDINSKISKNKIYEYLNKNLDIEINKKKIDFIYLGIEKKNEMFILYAEIEDLKSLNSIQIKNTILFDSFEDQKNIIHFISGSKRKSYILNKKKNNILFDL